MLFFSVKAEKFREPIEGIVEEAIASTQPGRVKYDGTFWPAQLPSHCKANVSAGDRVAIVGIKGITLIVIPSS